MRHVLVTAGAAGLLMAATGIATSQPMMTPGAGMHGQRPGMMGHGWGYADPAGYLADLKTVLGITAAQEPAWNDYADTVKGVAGQMQGLHLAMYRAMGTGTWEERRDMMNRMFEAREQAFDTVHDAAEKLLPSLDASQRAMAATRLPGLADRRRGPGMMGRGGPHTP